MKTLKALFRKVWHFFGDDRLWLMFSGYSICQSLNDIYNGEEWGFAFLAVSVLISFLAFRDLDPKVRA